MSKHTTPCLECGNPCVRLIWGGDTGIKWTGSCQFCGSIIFVDKEEIIFV